MKLPLHTQELMIKAAVTTIEHQLWVIECRKNAAPGTQYPHVPEFTKRICAGGRLSGFTRQLIENTDKLLHWADQCNGHPSKELDQEIADAWNAFNDNNPTVHICTKHERASLEAA